MQDDRDEENFPETAVAEDVGGERTGAFRDDQRCTRDGCPRHVAARCQQSAEVDAVGDNVHHFISGDTHAIGAGNVGNLQHRTHGISSRLERGKAGTDAGADEQRTQNVVAREQLLHQYIDDDKFTQLFNDSDHHGAPGGRNVGVHHLQIEQKQRYHQRRASAHQEEFHHVVDADVPEGIDLKKEHHRRKRYGEGTHNDKARIGICIVEQDAADVKQHIGDDEAEEDPAVEPGLGPRFGHFVERRRSPRRSADEDVLRFLPAVPLEYI